MQTRQSAGRPPVPVNDAPRERAASSKTAPTSATSTPTRGMQQGLHWELRKITPLKQVQPWHSCPEHWWSPQAWRDLKAVVALAPLGMVGLHGLRGLFQPKWSWICSSVMFLFFPMLGRDLQGYLSQSFLWDCNIHSSCPLGHQETPKRKEKLFANNKKTKRKNFHPSPKAPQLPKSHGDGSGIQSPPGEAQTLKILMTNFGVFWEKSCSHTKIRMHDSYQSREETQKRDICKEWADSEDLKKGQKDIGFFPFKALLCFIISVKQQLAQVSNLGRLKLFTCALFTLLTNSKSTKKLPILCPLEKWRDIWATFFDKPVFWDCWLPIFIFLTELYISMYNLLLLKDQNLKDVKIKKLV